MGKLFKKNTSFRINGMVKEGKALVNVKGTGKIFLGLNIVLRSIL